MKIYLEIRHYLVGNSHKSKLKLDRKGRGGCTQAWNSFKYELQH